MERFTKEKEDALNAIIKCMDSRVGLEKIDYDKEVVSLNYIYNKGSNAEWVEHNFYEVNTACDSVPCAIYEVVKAVFEKCVL